MIPSYTISKGRLVGVPFRLARCDTGKTLNPSAIVLHETAGPLTKDNCVKYFEGKEAGVQRKVSAHIVIDRDGTVTQMVPFNKRANHAGASSWRGKQYCNGFTIGIEIVGPGEIDPKTRRAWFQKSGGFSEAEVKPTPKAFQKSHDPGKQGLLWLPYTPEQIASTKAVCRAIMEEYEDCNEILTHYLISPGRKVDVNPLFPLDEVRRYAEGHDDKPDVAPVVVPDPVPVAVAPQPATVAVPVLVSGPSPVQVSANQPMTLTDLTSVSRHIGLAVRFRNWVRGVLGLGVSGYALGFVDYTKGVYNELASFVQSNALILAVVGAFASLWLLERISRGGLVAAQEGRYLPSGAVGAGMGQDSPLPGPRGDDLAGS